MTDNHLQIRPADQSDVPAILDVMLAAFAEYDGVLVPRSGAHTETRESVARRLRDGGALVADLDGRIAGCAFHQTFPSGFVYFSRLSVLPEFRNRGVGRALVAEVERRARAGGARGVHLGVRLQLPHLVARYERLGYRIVEHMTHEGHRDPTWVIMEKPV